MLPALLFTVALAGDAHVEIKDNPPGFALEPGFIEAVPETPIVVVIEDVAPTDELALDIVRIGPLGRDKAKLTVTIDGRARALTVVGVTVEARKVGKQFASLPVHQRVPLPTGSAVVQIKVAEPMGLRITVEKAPPAVEIPLVPLDEPPTTTATTPPTTTATPPTTTTPTEITPPPVAPTIHDATAGDATVGTAPAVVAPVMHSDDENPWPKLYAEVHAGGSVVGNGLQVLVPAGGFRVMIGPRKLDAALGVALDFDGQGAFTDEGRWDAAMTRLRLEGIIGLGVLDAMDAELDLAVGAGARITQHGAHGKGINANITEYGATFRVAPEGSFPAGPGDFLVAVPLDVGFDIVPDDVTNFAPVAVGVLLGYRLEL